LSICPEKGTGYWREDDMSYSMDSLKAKIVDFYPEIEKHQLETSMTFDEGKNVYVVKVQKGEHVLTTFLEKADADSCMEGNKCIYLGLHIAEFVKNFELEEK
jgi:hypothetical protein